MDPVEYEMDPVECVADLTERLKSGEVLNFTDDELDAIDEWGGDDSEGKGVFYDRDIIDAYDLDVKEGENTWPKLAAYIRQRQGRAR